MMNPENQRIGLLVLSVLTQGTLFQALQAVPLATVTVCYQSLFVSERVVRGWGKVCVDRLSRSWLQ